VAVFHVHESNPQVKQISLVGFSDVYGAKHGKDTIYVGRDQAIPVNWSVFVNGEWEEIDGAQTLRDAKELGHSQYDKDKACSLKLDWRVDWHLVDATRLDVANSCPDCGNPVTDDDEDKGVRRCPDCGWEHLYTTQEAEGIRKLADDSYPRQ
jgi:DNA-directed RNA polymerase subunit RPC12/RpoP